METAAGQPARFGDLWREIGALTDIENAERVAYGEYPL